ncbi:membrane protein [Streptomyces sp. MMG1121]|nr:membrane protein [Streptomyces sp. MMG1121]
MTRAARPAVQLRRLLVAAASTGTGFLLLSCLGYALRHPESADAAALRLVWCAVPLAATAYLALAVARTDPGTRARTGLSAVGLGPARLMAMSALTTALSCTLGSLLALLVFLRLRGDPTGLPFGGTAADFLAADQPLPVPAALTLLLLVPVPATATVALFLRPRDPRPAAGRRRFGRFGAYRRSTAQETFGTYGRFGARRDRPPAGSRTSEAAADPDDSGDATAPDTGTGTAPEPPVQDPEPARTIPASQGTPAGLPWGTSVLVTGLAVHSYAGHEALAVLLGWLLIATGLVLAAPGLTHLCGRLLQSVRPGALRLLAGRALMAEATRIGRPLGVVCAVASAGYAMTTLYTGPAPAFGPLTTLGAAQVTGCAVATLLTAAVETRQCRADTTAALLRLGAPATMLRAAAALRAAALLAVFGPLTLAVATLAALPANR